MILDFTNRKKVLNQAEKAVLEANVPKWERDIFDFILWYENSEKPLLQNTSGSTGKPKEIELTRIVLEQSARATIEFFQLEKNSSALLCIPAQYIGGKMMILRAIIGQWKLTCVEPKLDLESFLNDNEKFNFSAMIPAQASRLLDSKPSVLLNINQLILGGAAVNSQLEQKLFENNINAFSTFGMTETASHVALKKLDNTSEFKALSGITFSVDEDSRLEIHGERIPNSPLLTNDLVELSSNKSFRWLGRFDNVINSGGVKIIAEELEKSIATLLTEPFYITHEPHSELGEVPVLAIESKEWSAERITKLKASLKEILPTHWSPKKVKFLSEFQRTESGKIRRI